jgi:hypothetical protein
VVVRYYSKAVIDDKVRPEIINDPPLFDGSKHTAVASVVTLSREEIHQHRVHYLSAQHTFSRHS